VENRGMESIHFPIKDKWIPNSMDELIYLVEKIIVLLRAGKKVVVHCNGGKGRSGTVLVATLVGLGSKVQQAIDVVRKTRSGTIRNPLQIAYVKRFKSAWFKHKQMDKMFLKDDNESTDDFAPEDDSENLPELMDNHKTVEITEPSKTVKLIDSDFSQTPIPIRRMTVSTYKVDNITSLNAAPSSLINSPLPSETFGKSLRNFLSKNLPLTEAIDKKNKKIKKKDSKKNKDKNNNKKKESLDLIEGPDHITQQPQLTQPIQLPQQDIQTINNLGTQTPEMIEVVSDTEESLIETTIQ